MTKAKMKFADAKKVCGHNWGTGWQIGAGAKMMMQVRRCLRCALIQTRTVLHGSVANRERRTPRRKGQRMTLSSPCIRNLHKNCGRKMRSGRVCECDCHAAVNKANRDSIGNMSKSMAKRIKAQSSDKGITK